MENKEANTMIVEIEGKTALKLCPVFVTTSQKKRKKKLQKRVTKMISWLGASLMTKGYSIVKIKIVSMESMIC